MLLWRVVHSALEGDTVDRGVRLERELVGRGSLDPRELELHSSLLAVASDHVGPVVPWFVDCRVEEVPDVPLRRVVPARPDVGGEVSRVADGGEAALLGDLAEQCVVCPYCQQVDGSSPPQARDGGGFT